MTYNPIPEPGTFNSCSATQRALDYHLKPEPAAPRHPPATERIFQVSHGISGAEALNHAASVLRCAAAAAYESADNLRGNERDMAFSVVHMLDIARTLLDRSLEDVTVGAGGKAENF